MTQCSENSVALVIGEEIYNKWNLDEMADNICMIDERRVLINCNTMQYWVDTITGKKQKLICQKEYLVVSPFIVIRMAWRRLGITLSHIMGILYCL